MRASQTTSNEAEWYPKYIEEDFPIVLHTYIPSLLLYNQCSLQTLHNPALTKNHKKL